MTNAQVKPAPPRIKPSVLMGIIAWAGYTLFFYGLATFSGIPYTEWFANGDNAMRAGVIPLVAGSVFLLAFVFVTRWSWIWRDPIRLTTTRFMKLTMILWFVAIAVRVVGTEWSKIPPSLLVMILLAGVGVGFAEELMFRGIFLRAMREGGRAEAWAAIWTAVVFGAFHFPNILLGTGIAGLSQLVLAALSGILLYLFRRQFGVIWPAMIAHGIWDISAFVGPYYATWLTLASLGMQILFVILAIVVIVQLVRSDRQVIVIPATEG
jgi:uncharacterized protein